jgi:hypothetical protein
LAVASRLRKLNVKIKYYENLIKYRCLRKVCNRLPMTSLGVAHTARPIVTFLDDFRLTLGAVMRLVLAAIEDDR